jgi:hypothetical protein
VETAVLAKKQRREAIRLFMLLSLLLFLLLLYKRFRTVERGYTSRVSQYEKRDQDTILARFKIDDVATAAGGKIRKAKKSEYCAGRIIGSLTKSHRTEKVRYWLVRNHVQKTNAHKELESSHPRKSAT